MLHLGEPFPWHTIGTGLTSAKMKSLSQLFGRKRQAEVPPPNPDQPLWVIGDIHGCDALLQNLVDQIGAQDVLPPEAHVLLVGDYIDRGDDSARVLERLFVWAHETEGLTMLKGNHEEMMLDFLADPARRGRHWLRHGGLQTLASFGIGGLGQSADGDQLRLAAEDLQSKLPNGLIEWLDGLPTRWSSGNVHVVHAGANPELPMALQSEETLLWGHEGFARTPRTDGQWVVHGHTITDRPGSDGQGRIAVDTGAYATGRLTAVLIEPDGSVSCIHT